MLASKPPKSDELSCEVLDRSARRLIASSWLRFDDDPEDGAAGAGVAAWPGSGGNCSPPLGAACTGAARSPPFMGLATPKDGRAPGLSPPGPFLLPNALIPNSPGQTLHQSVQGALPCGEASLAMFGE